MFGGSPPFSRLNEDVAVRRFQALVFWLCLAIPTVALAQQRPTSLLIGIGVGLAAEGPTGRSDNAFSIDAHAEFTAWRAAPVGLGVDGSIWTGVDNGCDQVCNGRTRAYGAAVHASVGGGSLTSLQFGLGAGPFRARYSKPALGGGLDEVEQTVLGAIADVDYSPRLGLAIHPIVSLRGLLLPARNSTRASFVSLGVGLSIP